MNANTEINRDLILEQMATLATLATGPLLAARHERDRIIAEITTYTNASCTGTLHWRDPGGNPKLYIIHATGQACPLHGTPARGTRIRTYIGTNPAKQAEATDQVCAEATLRKLRARLARIERALSSASYNLRRYYADLQWTVPTDPRGYPEHNGFPW